MTEANIISITSAYRKLDSILFDSYLEYHSIGFRKNEIIDLEKLVNLLRSITDDANIFDRYFIGYSIPQIGKEFDLLRIDDESIVNIEIKKKKNSKKIVEQILRNKYYLSFLNRELSIFTYVADENKLFCLNKESDLEEIEISRLIEILNRQNVKRIKSLDSIFIPTNYLVSPFNLTQEFIEGKYFLTSQQEDFKNIIENQFDSLDFSIMAIKGKAGTGKTLLIYDIAKELSKKNNVLIVHCGLLNNGQKILCEAFGWNIVPAKELYNQRFSNLDTIIIDEAQRLYLSQFNFIIDRVKSKSINCIFSYDEQQTLRKDEIQNKIYVSIENEITWPVLCLTTRIRTNKEVSSFIKCLFNKKNRIETFNYSSVEVKYFENTLEAKQHLDYLYHNGFKVINYTPSTKYTLPYESYKIDLEVDNAHTVIGQEFDNVAAVIDDYFYYKDGMLSTRNYINKPYYHPTKMLYQIVSRTRIRLCIVIINNPEVLNRCLNILLRPNSHVS